MQHIKSIQISLLAVGRFLNLTAPQPFLPVDYRNSSASLSTNPDLYGFSSDHWCQLNVKSIARLGMNSQSNSKSHLKMTK